MNITASFSVETVVPDMEMTDICIGFNLKYRLGRFYGDTGIGIDIAPKPKYWYLEFEWNSNGSNTPYIQIGPLGLHFDIPWVGVDERSA